MDIDFLRLLFLASVICPLMQEHSFRLFSLRSWRYCVGARLKFWRRSRVPKKGSKISLDYITTAPPPNLTRLLHNTAS